MAFSIDDLRAFLEISRTGSFTMAADKLFVTSPAITRRIKKMEEQIGEMFETVALTMSGNRATTIRFACVTSVAGSVLPLMLADFQSKFPTSRFDLHDGHGTIVHRLVEEQVVEFGIGTRPEPY